jgi:hypothetical protein
MRGRKPKALTIPSTERVVLEWIAHNPTLPDYQRARAQLMLALMDGARVQDLAQRFECVGSTVWRIRRRYECGGLSELLADGRRRDLQLRADDALFAPAPAGCAG